MCNLFSKIWILTSLMWNCPYTCTALLTKAVLKKGNNKTYMLTRYEIMLKGTMLYG